MALLVLGDSISGGFGASDPRILGYGALLRQNHQPTWPEFSGRDLQAHYGTDFAAAFLTRSGATTEDFTTMLQRAAAPGGDRAHSGPPLGVMTLGGNDLKNGLFQAGLAGMQSGRGIRDAASYASGALLHKTLENLRQLVGTLRQEPLLGKDAQLYLANVYDPSDGLEKVQTPWGTIQVSGFGDVMHAWRNGYEFLGRDLGITIVDAWSAFLGHGLSASASSLWLSDWIHPNDRGHHELRRLFLTAMGILPAAGHIG